MTSRAAIRPTSLLRVAILACALAFALLACGKKTPPKPVTTVVYSP